MPKLNAFPIIWNFATEHACFTTSTHLPSIRISLPHISPITPVSNNRTRKHRQDARCAETEEDRNCWQSLRRYELPSSSLSKSFALLDLALLYFTFFVAVPLL
jgi:hypothetical protein